MLTFYADEINSKELDSEFDPGNTVIKQYVLGPNGKWDYRNFSLTTTLDIRTLDDVEIRSFSEPCNFDSLGVIAVGIAGGWSSNKLENLSRWLSSRNHPAVEKSLIYLDYSMEGFAYDEFFDDLHTWIRENKLDNRVIYATSCQNVNSLYSNWLQRTGQQPLMTAIYTGQFAKHFLMGVYHNLGAQFNDPRYRFNDCKTFDELKDLLNEKFASEDSTYSERFMCLNRRPHCHRIMFTVLLHRLNLLNEIAYSYPKDFSEDPDWLPNKMDDAEYMWDLTKEVFGGYIDSWESSYQELYNNHLPMVVDRADFDHNHMQDISYSTYIKRPINIVTESFATTPAIFFSEKIWKPILFKQIFLVWSSPYYLKGLHEIGIRTFHPWINESYDAEEDHIERALAIGREIKRISKMDDEEFAELVENCRQITRENFDRLLNYNYAYQESYKELIGLLQSLQQE
jgi:hypothetical protein